MAPELQQRAKEAGYTWKEVKSAVRRGHVSLQKPLPAAPELKAALRGMMLGEPPKSGASGSGSRAARRQSRDASLS